MLAFFPQSCRLFVIVGERSAAQGLCQTSWADHRQTSWADHRQTKIRARLRSSRVLCNRPFKLPHRRAQNIPYEKNLSALNSGADARLRAWSGYGAAGAKETAAEPRNTKGNGIL